MTDRPKLNDLDFMRAILDDPERGAEREFMLLVFNAGLASVREHIARIVDGRRGKDQIRQAPRAREQRIARAEDVCRLLDEEPTLRPRLKFLLRTHTSRTRVADLAEREENR